MKTSGFTRFSHDLLNGILQSSLNARELKVVLLIHRLTEGCHREWAVVRQCDFQSAGIGPTHIEEVKRLMISKGVMLQNGEKQEYKNNGAFFYINKEIPNRLVTLVGKHLRKRPYPKGNANLPVPVIDTLPNREVLYSQIGNMPSLESATPKDNGKDKIKNNDKDIDIGDEQKDFNTIIQNPTTKKEADAVSLWEMLEPNRPESFGIYLKAVNHVSTNALFQYVSEIKQDEKIAPINRGKVFTVKVYKQIFANKLSGQKIQF